MSTITRAGASLLILISGLLHLVFAPVTSGLGELTLAIFGGAYIATSLVISMRNYVTGIVVPLAGLLVGLYYINTSVIDYFFLSIEGVVIALNVLLGYQQSELR